MENNYQKSNAVSKLLKQVSLHPVLYNPHHCMYKCNHTRMSAWKEIASQMKIPVANCQMKWATLRRCLANARKRQVKRHQAGSKYVKKWRYQNEMSFLDPYLERIPTSKTITLKPVDDKTRKIADDSDFIHAEIFFCESNDDEEEELDMKPDIFTSSESYKDVKNPYQSIAEMYIEEGDVEGLSTCKMRNPLQRLECNANSNFKPVPANISMDEMDTFFLGMSRALKKLPFLDQIKVRSEVYNTVTEAEMNWLKSKANFRNF